MSKIYQDHKTDLTVQEKKALKSRVSAISNQLSAVALVTIKEQLVVAAENEAGTDETKVYLELAKIEHYFGNETSTDSYISTAIYSSQDCEDDSYVSAMTQIITVISNDEDSDTENIKNVTEYVNAVLDHSLTVNVESIVSLQYQTPSPSDNNSDNKDNNSLSVDFAQTAIDYVSRIKSSISIGKLDTSNFEEIAARVQIDSDYITDIDELKAALKVYDCGAELSDFTLKKIDYTGSNIILACDVSGSMDGSIQDLRDAVVTFITDKNANESLSVVTFNASIVETKSFGTPDDSLISFAESMRTGGGTDMFSAVVNCLGNFSSRDSENNVLILMTDGQDNYPRSSKEIYEEIGELALKKGVTVYTLGLGSYVDTAYLNTIAGSGNGEFVYVSDSVSLTSFYDMIHSQLYSQYELTYKALDTITMSGRTLEVTLPSEKLRDVKTYSLDGADENEGGLEVSQNLSVSGMSPRYISGERAIYVSINGEEGNYKVKEEGELAFNLNEGTNTVYAEIESDDLVSYIVDTRVYYDVNPPEIILYENLDGKTFYTDIVAIIGKLVGGSTLKIDGKNIETDDKGEFSYSAGLSLGENLIEIEAEDVNGNAAKMVLTFYRASNIIGSVDAKSGWVQLLPLLAAILVSILIIILSLVFMKKKEKAQGDKKYRILPLILWDILVLVAESGCIWQFISRYLYSNSMSYLELVEKSASEAAKYLRLEKIFKIASGAGLLIFAVSIIITVFWAKRNKKKKER